MGNGNWVWVAACVACVACSSDGGGDDDSGGGSGATGGSSTNGGSGGSGASGGSGGSGGSTGGSSGTSGGSGGSSSIPMPTGTIGTGTVECINGMNGNMCATGMVCCVDHEKDTEPQPCVSGFSACTCAVEGDCTAVGCDADADCGAGMQCCGLRNTKASPLFVATSCKAACGSGEMHICSTAADCASPATCHASTLQFGYCY